MKDVAIIGAGIAGMATAARLQARGLSTIVFEAHVQPGGCAGFYRRKGFDGQKLWEQLHRSEL
jgi:phytoene dehydrogenase-like protein